MYLIKNNQHILICFIERDAGFLSPVQQCRFSFAGTSPPQPTHKPGIGIWDKPRCALGFFSPPKGEACVDRFLLTLGC